MSYRKQKFTRKKSVSAKRPWGTALYVIAFCLAAIFMMKSNILYANAASSSVAPNDSSVTYAQVFPDEKFAEHVVGEINVLTQGNLTVSSVAMAADLARIQMIGIYAPERYEGIDSFDGIQHLTSLKTLRVENDIHCDTALLENLTSLEYLTLHGNANGDIASLQNLTALKSLILGGNVSGNISALSNLASLEDLWLFGDKLSGDMSSIKDMTSLTGVSVSAASITGDLSDFSKLVNLERIYIDAEGGLDFNVNIGGDLSSLSELVNLESLALEYASPSISGDINSLGKLTNLRSLDLPGKKYIQGSLSALSNFTSLGYLDLSGTSVSGDISSLQGLTNLRNLHLRDTNVEKSLLAMSEADAKKSNPSAVGCSA